MNSVKLEDKEGPCFDLDILVRAATIGLPKCEEIISDYSEVHKDDVSIFNQMWTCRGLRKIHLERAITPKVEILHSVFWPDPEYNLPIFGMDIVVAGNKVTAAIVDISPVHGTEDMKRYREISEISSRYNFSGIRHLPEWGDVFSPFCKFQRLETSDDIYNFYSCCQEYIKVYTQMVRESEHDFEWIDIMKRYDDQLHYVNQQRKNTKTKAVLSQWFGNDWADTYIEQVLFDKPKL